MSALSHVYRDRGSVGGRRRQTFAALAVSAVAGLAIFVTAAGSLMAGAEAAPPAVKSPPPGWIDVAFADAGAASAGTVAQPQQNQTAPLQSAPVQSAPLQSAPKQDARKQGVRKPDPCADFTYFFLNKACSVKRVGSVRRDGFGRRAVASRTVPAIVSQDAARAPERVTLAATSTVATD